MKQKQRTKSTNKAQIDRQSSMTSLNGHSTRFMKEKGKFRHGFYLQNVDLIYYPKTKVYYTKTKVYTYNTFY